jgi:hypothetical protein
MTEPNAAALLRKIGQDVGIGLDDLTRKQAGLPEAFGIDQFGTGRNE